MKDPRTAFGFTLASICLPRKQEELRILSEINGEEWRNLASLNRICIELEAMAGSSRLVRFADRAESLRDEATIKFGANLIENDYRAEITAAYLDERWTLMSAWATCKCARDLCGRLPKSRDRDKLITFIDEAEETIENPAYDTDTEKRHNEALDFAYGPRGMRDYVFRGCAIQAAWTYKLAQSIRVRDTNTAASSVIGNCAHVSADLVWIERGHGDVTDDNNREIHRDKTWDKIWREERKRYVGVIATSFGSLPWLL